MSVPSFGQGQPQLPQGRPSLGPWAAGILIVAAIALTVYLIAFHWLHLLDALPYVLGIGFMGLCMFGHGHGGHGGHGSDDSRTGDGGGHAH